MPSASLLTQSEYTLPKDAANALNLACEQATVQWRKDLQALFYDARNRFPDIVWTTPDEGEVIWGHKAIIYANPNKLPVAIQTYPPTDAKVKRKITVVESSLSRADLTTKILSLYTVNSGNFLSAEAHITPPTTAPDIVAANLYRDNLIAVWKDKLHIDIQIYVPWTGKEATKHRKGPACRFSTHQFILGSRSPVLINVLRYSNGSSSTGITLETFNAPLIQMTLPYPPFTPYSFYYILEFMYSGTIDFRPDREFSLDIAFSIIRSSIFLVMPTLEKLIVAYIIVKMAHGLFNAYLPDAKYLRLVGTSWSRMVKAGGCQCTDCTIRVPLVLRFALENNLHSDVLQRGAQRALIVMFGPRWCSDEFASVSDDIRLSILSSVLKNVTPENAIALLFASQKGLDKLDEAEQHWDITVRGMLLTVREHVEEVIYKESGACLGSERWGSIMSMDTPMRKEYLDVIMKAVLRVAQAKRSFSIVSLYQTFALLETPDTPENVSVCEIVEHIKSELRERMGLTLRLLFSAMPSISLSTPFSFATADKNLNDNASRRSLAGTRESGASSIYSDITYQTAPQSIAQSNLDADRLLPWSSEGARSGFDANAEWDYSQSEILANPSMYSHASSRTLSTDYGLFYTRHALSEGSTSVYNGRRNSWDSLISAIEKLA